MQKKDLRSVHLNKEVTAVHKNWRLD